MADKNELDDFWSIDKLVPKKKTKIGSFSPSPRTAEVLIGGSDEKEGESSRGKLNFSEYLTEKTDGGERTYSPTWNSLIKRVTVKPTLDRFDFYGTFRKAALIYYDYKCDKCDFVPFYSYMPQYSQMTTEQKRYYFYWRDMLRRGTYLKTDYSYVYLYAYEILNLPDKISAEDGLSMLIDVWAGYRDALPVLDNNFSVWVQDYCLIYGLEFPKDELSPMMFDIISKSDFKEFYISDIGSAADGVSSLIAYLSDYDWRCGKYASGDNSEAYRKHIEGAMYRVLSKMWKSGSIAGEQTKRLIKNAFPGSLCTHLVKRVLEIEYYPVADSPSVRSSVTSALKYTENKLRAALGVKSRLAVKEFPEEYRREIDGYFSLVFEEINRERRRASMPEYEKLYDAKSSEISIEDAVRIERESWRVTENLVAGTEDDFEYVTESEEPVPDISEENAPRSDNEYGLTEDELAFLGALCRGDITAARNIAQASGRTADSLSESINERFSDTFGDVIIGQTDSFFDVLDDYKEEISEWTLRNLK